MRQRAPTAPCSGNATASSRPYARRSRGGRGVRGACPRSAATCREGTLPEYLFLWRSFQAVMVEVTVSDVVRAPPEKVFAFLCDLENWPRWQSDMRSRTLVAGERARPGAEYRYVSKAMGQTFDSKVKISRLDPGRLVAFEGEWAGMIRPSGEYRVEPTPGGSKVTLDPHPEARGFGKVMAPLMGVMIRRMNRQHLASLKQQLEP